MSNIQSIEKNPHIAYIQLINTRELYIIYSEKQAAASLAKLSNGQVYTTAIGEEIIKQVLLEMESENLFN